MISSESGLDSGQEKRSSVNVETKIREVSSKIINQKLRDIRLFPKWNRNSVNSANSGLNQNQCKTWTKHHLFGTTFKVWLMS